MTAVTQVFKKTLQAYNNDYRFIANIGGTRSSKTFSTLQLINQIQIYSNQPLLITVVSHSFPHLEGGAIRDYEKILQKNNYDLSSVKHVLPRRYKINKSLVEYIGFDRPGKALGAARDILYINEANKMPFNICHQLMQRTNYTIFLDWNPSDEFWWQLEGYNKRENAIEIHSTYLDNINPETKQFNLTKGQLDEFIQAKDRAIKEDKKGMRSYWWNWWQVYGLGLPGQLEGVIFQNWKTCKKIPYEDCTIQMFVIDWGGNDPTTLTELNFNSSTYPERLYIKEHIYKPQILNRDLIRKCTELCTNNQFFIYDSARRDKGYELKMAGLPAFKSNKYPGVKLDNIDSMQEFDIFILESSTNAIDEFSKYKWAKDRITGKSLNQPEDCNDHICDPVGYGVEFYRRNIKPN